jgi:hypothetical protein
MRDHLRRSALLAIPAIGAFSAAAASAQTYTDVVMSGGPAFYWNFNESGNTDAAVDRVGTEVGDNLLAQGNATRVGSTSTAGGLGLGRAASFVGSQPTRFFSNTLSPSGDFDAWAIEMWVRPGGADPGDRFNYLLEARGDVAGGPGTNSPGILFDYGNNDRVELFHNGSRTGGDGPLLANGVWRHLVIASYGAANDQVDFYLDGAPAGSSTYFGDSTFGTNVIAVGNSIPGGPTFDHFTGEIDELAVYNLTGMDPGAISAKAAAIAKHFSATAVPEPTGLLGLGLVPALLIRRRRPD